MKKHIGILLIAIFTFIASYEDSFALRPTRTSTLQERAAARRAARLGQVPPKPAAVIPSRPVRRRSHRTVRRELKKTPRTPQSIRQKARERRAQRLSEPVQETTSTIAQMRNEVFRLTNLEREKVGLEPLRYNGLLETAAQRHAEDMHRRSYFDHYTPEGKHFDKRIQQAGYGFVDIDSCNCRSFSVFYAENNAKGQRTPEQVVNDWMLSEGHRENILSTKIDEIGIGIEADLWVQNFGKIVVEPR